MAELNDGKWQIQNYRGNIFSVSLSNGSVLLLTKQTGGQHERRKTNKRSRSVHKRHAFD